MKKLIFASVFLSLAFNANAQSSNHKVIYGTDSRVDIDDYPDARFQKIGESVAGMVNSSELRLRKGLGANPDTYTFSHVSLQERLNVCPEEKFSQQASLASCTGFLVEEDILVTAGHCVETIGDCLSRKWVFGFKDGVDEFDKDDVYSCVGIKEHGNALGLFSQKDYAVLQLDRAVKDREPLKYRDTGRPRWGTELVVIGHPSGLPMKVADDAQVRRDRINFFYANTDTYGGNSGSPVFNKETGEVEGILVRSRAGTDYVDSSRGCKVSRHVDYDRSREIIQRITRVPGL